MLHRRIILGAIALFISFDSAFGGTQTANFSVSGPYNQWPQQVAIPPFNQQRGTLYEGKICMSTSGSFVGMATASPAGSITGTGSTSAWLYYFDAVGSVPVHAVSESNPVTVSGTPEGTPISYSGSAFGCKVIGQSNLLSVVSTLGVLYVSGGCGVSVPFTFPPQPPYIFVSGSSQGQLAGSIDYKYVAAVPFPPTPRSPLDIDDLPPWPELTWTPSQRDFDGNKAEIRRTNAPTEPPLDPQPPAWKNENIPPQATRVQPSSANNQAAGGVGPQGLESCGWYEWRVIAVNAEATGASVWKRFRVGVAGDINHDSMTDDADFSLFVLAYDLLDCLDPAMPAGCPADLNRDSVVDDSDFLGFVRGYDTLICP